MKEQKVIAEFKRTNSKVFIIAEDDGTYTGVYSNLRERLMDLIIRKAPNGVDFVTAYINKEIPKFIKIKGKDPDKVVTSLFRAFKSYHELVIAELTTKLTCTLAILVNRYHPILKYHFFPPEEEDDEMNFFLVDEEEENGDSYFVHAPNFDYSKWGKPTGRKVIVPEDGKSSESLKDSIQNVFKQATKRIDEISKEIKKSLE